MAVYVCLTDHYIVGSIDIHHGDLLNVLVRYFDTAVFVYGKSNVTCQHIDSAFRHCLFVKCVRSGLEADGLVFAFLGDPFDRSDICGGAFLTSCDLKLCACDLMSVYVCLADHYIVGSIYVHHGLIYCSAQVGQRYFNVLCL